MVETVDKATSAAGRWCPPSYYYGAGALRHPPTLSAPTVYVVGGLYGNVEALRAILEMKQAEEQTGTPVAVVFNGDFNWFDTDDSGFVEINETVLAHTAIGGNVEAELGGDSGIGCGCNYPGYVDQGTVDRSNEIMARLRERARQHAHLTRQLTALPRHITAQVGGEPIGIVHGDAESLAGWGFALENVEPLDQVLRPLLGCRPADPVTTEAQVQRYFRDAAVRAFACTHTCLPFAQGFLVDGRWHLLINNGAAGMPNFRGMTTGLITRISDQPAPPPASLYGAQVGGARFDAIPVAYDHAAWTERFLRNWPAGSAAHRSYFERIDRGPNFHLVQAIRRGVQPGAAANAAE